MTRTLNELAVKYDADKRDWLHGYAKLYEREFRGIEVNNLLEIGVYCGASHFMWRTYFEKANIYGIDIDPKAIERAWRKMPDPRIKLDVVDQGDREALTTYANNTGVKFDVIIDDGGHKMSQQITSFEVLWPFVSGSGIYVVEDIFTSYWTKSKYKYVDQETTCVEYFKRIIDEIQLASEQGSSGYADVDRARHECARNKRKALSMHQDTIEHISFYNGMIMIRKYPS
jgi:hypothetical protein